MPLYSAEDQFKERILQERNRDGAADTLIGLGLVLSSIAYMIWGLSWTTGIISLTLFAVAMTGVFIWKKRLTNKRFGYAKFMPPAWTMLRTRNYLLFSYLLALGLCLGFTFLYFALHPGKKIFENGVWVFVNGSSMFASQYISTIEWRQHWKKAIPILLLVALVEIVDMDLVWGYVLLGVIICGYGLWDARRFLKKYPPLEAADGE